MCVLTGASIPQLCLCWTTLSYSRPRALFFFHSVWTDFFLFSSASLLEKEMLILKVLIWDPEIEFCSIVFTVWVLRSESGDIVVQWLDKLKQLTVCCQHKQVKSHFHLWKYICYHHFAAFLAFASSISVPTCTQILVIWGKIFIFPPSPLPAQVFAEGRDDLSQTDRY